MEGILSSPSMDKRYIFAEVLTVSSSTRYDAWAADLETKGIAPEWTFPDEDDHFPEMNISLEMPSPEIEHAIDL